MLQAGLSSGLGQGGVNTINTPLSCTFHHGRLLQPDCGPMHPILVRMMSVDTYELSACVGKKMGCLASGATSAAFSTEPGREHEPSVQCLHLGSLSRWHMSEPQFMCFVRITGSY